MCGYFLQCQINALTSHLCVFPEGKDTKTVDFQAVYNSILNTLAQGEKNQGRMLKMKSMDELRVPNHILKEIRNFDEKEFRRSLEFHALERAEIRRSLIEQFKTTPLKKAELLVQLMKDGKEADDDTKAEIEKKIKELTAELFLDTHPKVSKTKLDRIKK